jgi:class 3 adenylate cyclase
MSSRPAAGASLKTLGDEVVFVAAAPATAAAIACDLVAALGDKPDLPDIRVGIATGPVVARLVMSSAHRPTWQHDSRPWPAGTTSSPTLRRPKR